MARAAPDNRRRTTNVTPRIAVRRARPRTIQYFPQWLVPAIRVVAGLCYLDVGVSAHKVRQAIRESLGKRETGDGGKEAVIKRVFTGRNSLLQIRVRAAAKSPKITTQERSNGGGGRRYQAGAPAWGW